MSLAENLLNSLAETTTQSASPINDILMIDAESRTINVPATETLFGVVTDGNVERKYFKCPRIVGDNIDLTTLGLRIYYRNALGEDDGYIVTDVKVSGEYITFSWKLESKLFKANGPIYFAVCAVDVDGNGVETCAWNTTLASGNVLDGFRISDLNETEEEQARNILQQLLNLLQTRSDEAVQAVADEGAEQVSILESVGAEQRSLIESKGAETLVKIPEDYTTTYNNADESLRKKAKSILLEETGEVITVDDASDDHVRGLKVFGKSEQVTTTGKNLLRITAKTQTLNGVTFTVNHDGSITVNGTAEKNIYLSIGTYSVEPDKYILSGCNGGKDGSDKTYLIYSQKASDASGYVHCVDGGTEFDISDNDERNVLIAVYSGVKISNVTFYPMIRLATIEDSTYEPYTGGKPSPNPEYPQEIVSVGNPTIKVHGKNLWPNHIKDYSADNGSTVFVRPDGGIIVYKVAGQVLSLKTTVYFPKGIYTMSNGLDTGSDVYLQAFDVATSGSRSKVTVYWPGGNTNVYLYAKETTECNVTLYPQIEFGSEATEYEPYKKLQTIAIPRSLPGIPVSSGGNYTDSDGQQWICDEVDFERSVYVKRVSKNVITSDMQVTLKTDRDDCNQIAFELLKYDDTVFVSRSVPGLCNKFKRGLYTVGCFNIGTVADSGWGGKSRITFYVDKSITTVEAFMEYIGDDCVVLTPLATPIETPLTADELDVFRTLHTNYPNTTVLNDSGATMQLLYNADTKGYIEKNYVSRLEYNDLVGRITALENK